MNPEQWLSLKWNGGSTMSDRWLNQSKIIQVYHKFSTFSFENLFVVNLLYQRLGAIFMSRYQLF